MELESIIKEFKESNITRKDFWITEGGEAYDVTAYKVNRIIRLDIKEHKE